MDFDDDITAPTTAVVAPVVPEKKIVPFEATSKALDSVPRTLPVECAAHQKAYEAFIWATSQTLTPSPEPPKPCNALTKLGWQPAVLNTPITIHTQPDHHLPTHPIKYTINARLAASDMLRILSAPLFFARTVQQDWPIMLGGAVFTFPGQVPVSDDTQAEIDATAGDMTWASTFTSAELATAAIVVSRDMAKTDKVPYFVKLRKVLVSGDRLLKHYDTLSKEAQQTKLPDGVGAQLVKRFVDLTARVNAAIQSIDAKLAPSACAFVLHECAMFDQPAVAKGPTPFDEQLKGPNAAPFRSHIIAQKNQYMLTLSAECKTKDAGVIRKIDINIYAPFISNTLYGYVKIAAEKAAGTIPVAAAAAAAPTPIVPAPTPQTIANATPATTAAVVASKSEFAITQQELATTPVKLPDGVVASQSKRKVSTTAKEEPATPAEKRKRADDDKGDEQAKKKGVAVNKDPDADVDDKVPPAKAPVVAAAAVATTPAIAAAPAVVDAATLAALETKYAIGTDAYKDSCIELTMKMAKFAQAMLTSQPPPSYAKRYGSAVQLLHKPPNDALKQQAYLDIGKGFAMLNYLGILPEAIAAAKAKHIDLPPQQQANGEPDLF